MATAQTITSPAAWAQRARELCDAANLKYTGRLTGEQDGTECYLVPSEDRTSEYLITHDVRTGRLRCGCPAGQHGRACKHAGAVLYAIEQRAHADSAEERAATVRYQATWEHVEQMQGGAREELAAYGLPLVDLPRIVPVLTEPRAACIDCGVELPASDLIEIDQGPDGEATRICAGCEWDWEMRMDREPMPYDAIA